MADELERYLDSLKREDRYRVDAVLKESAFEVTQRVYLVDESADGSAGGEGRCAERGPFIRKFIKRDKGLGVAYERIYAAQMEGRTFAHLPQVYECYVHDDDLVVVMELVEGQTLQDLVYGMDPSVELAQAVFPQVCDAVSELHEAFDPPIIHRDLKPSNVIVSFGKAPDVDARVPGRVPGSLPLSACRVFIIDFGIARDYRAGAEADTAHFGTRDFAPPEQFGYGQTSASSDVYALGLLLFFCLTETIPTADVRQAGYDDPRIPESMRRLIVQATSFDPEQRFKSASALKRAFENVVKGESPKMANPAGAAAAVSAGAATVPAPSPDGESAPHVLGRIWNVLVIGFAAFIMGALVYLLATGGLMSPDRVPYSPGASVVSFALGLVLTVLLAFACLDKRRLRERVPQLANLRAWQVWVLVFVWYLFTTVVRSAIS